MEQACETLEFFCLTEEELNVEAVMKTVMHASAGAALLFLGTVRQFTHGRETLQLRYEAYPSMALRIMREIGEEIQCKWPGSEVAIHHRTGMLKIGEIAVLIAVSCPHRREAYEASQYAIEQVKSRLPIWKQEYAPDGTFWVTSCCAHEGLTARPEHTETGEGRW
ncbi:molybdenum cofactor biosynthesis protein MoaE [Marinicrinis sediminis]|uniref:Molybdenum cofactor biosynthesis protein MoaE n=1 Tax=Marinicrinis sediminis TaxID=1652465 RepID=A0ABW5R6W2_9BACL